MAIIEHGRIIDIDAPIGWSSVIARSARVVLTTDAVEPASSFAVDRAGRDGEGRRHELYDSPAMGRSCHRSDRLPVGESHPRHRLPHGASRRSRTCSSSSPATRFGTRTRCMRGLWQLTGSRSRSSCVSRSARSARSLVPVVVFVVIGRDGRQPDAARARPASAGMLDDRHSGPGVAAHRHQCRAVARDDHLDLSRRRHPASGCGRRRCARTPS